MKNVYIIFVFICSLCFVNCNESNKSSQNSLAVENAIKVVSPQEVYNAIQADNSLQLVDVRTPEEYNVTHLKSSQNICVTTSDFKEKVAKLDTTKPIYVYCKKGGRSAKASKILAEMGFKEIYDLQGGITNWEDKELKTVKE